MKEEYESYNIPLHLRMVQFSQNQLIEVLDLAINKKKQVRFVWKNRQVDNVSWHIPLEVLPDRNSAIVRWWTNAGRYIEKSMKWIQWIFITTKPINPEHIAIYESLKELSSRPILIKQDKINLLQEIQKAWNQVRYMKLWVNNKNYRSQPKTILSIDNNYMTYWSISWSRFSFRTINLDMIGHIEEVYKKKDTNVFQRYVELQQNNSLAI